LFSGVAGLLVVVVDDDPHTPFGPRGRRLLLADSFRGHIAELLMPKVIQRSAAHQSVARPTSRLPAAHQSVTARQVVRGSIALAVTSSRNEYSRRYYC
jgi:hypothetical protein